MVLCFLGHFLAHPDRLTAAAVFADPIPRVDTGAHSGPIYWSEPFADGERLVTASGDKTLRIWRTKDLKPLRTLRVPLGAKQEGRLAFADISRDGKLIAAGGWTCWDWDGKGCVYVFDAEQGRLVKRIGGLPNIIGNLRFSPDGRHLAVGMHADGGVALIDVAEGKIVASDRQYGERITGLDFSSDGYLAAGALDGYIRIYDPKLQLQARAVLDDSKLIGAVYFSPDRMKLLVGAYDRPRLKILAFPELKAVAEFSAADVPGQTSLRNAVWSRSGKTIYAVGDSQDLSRGLIFRWDADDPKSRRTLPIPVRRVQCVRPLGEDGLLFSTEDSVIGVVDDAGHERRSDAAISAFPQQSDRFRVSSDASVVDFPWDRNGVRIGRFDVRSLAFEENAGSPGETEPARTESRRLALTDWRNSNHPKLNGKSLPLDPFEEGRSYGVAPDDSFLALGTEWALRAYRRDGTLVWRSSTPAAVWNTAVAGLGRLVVATLSDGTIRWYDAGSGAERMALFPHPDPDRRDWVLWRPDGYYASSDFGDNFVGWHVNRGKDLEPDFYRAVQFERLFYRPDLLKAQLYSDPSNQVPRRRKTGTKRSSMVAGSAPKHSANSATRKKRLEWSIERIHEIAPPRIRLTASRVAPGDDRRSILELSVEADKNSRPMQDVTLYVNSIPATVFADRRLSTRETGRFTRTFRVPISPGDNDLRIEVANGVSMGLYEQVVEAPGDAAAPLDERGDLYLLAVGVNRFEKIAGPDKARLRDLRFADHDAEAIAARFQAAAGTSFRHVHVRILTDNTEQAPRWKAILDALPFVESAGPQDTAIIFLASHGISDAAGNYFFIPKDATMTDIDAVLNGRNSSGKAPSLISWLDFFEAMRKAAGRRLLLVDACEAKNVQGTFDDHSLRKRSAAALFPLLLASKGNENSQEYRAARHGLFTYAVLGGLAGSADKNGDRKITIGELHGFTVPLVGELHNELLGPQTPQLVAPEELQSIAVIDSSAEQRHESAPVAR